MPDVIDLRSDTATKPALEPCWRARRALRATGVLTLSGTRMRLVTHLGVSAADIDRVIAGFSAFFRNQAAAVLK
ncbi:MAG TPA: hypothetical protein VLC47_11115 [Burkholderiales bacterium]|nr:hypothetical protein [Burkholderiales bacterium]